MLSACPKKRGEKRASRKCLPYSGVYYASTALEIGTGKWLWNDVNFKTGSGCTCVHVVVLLTRHEGACSQLMDVFWRFLWTISAK